MPNRGRAREHWEPSLQGPPTRSNRQPSYRVDAPGRSSEWRGGGGRGWQGYDGRYNDPYHYQSDDYRRIYYSDPPHFATAGSSRFVTNQPEFYGDPCPQYTRDEFAVPPPVLPPLATDGFVDFSIPPPGIRPDFFAERRVVAIDRSVSAQSQQGDVRKNSSGRNTAAGTHSPPPNRPPSELFFIDATPSPVIQTKKKKVGKKKKGDKREVAVKKVTEVTQEEDERAQKLRMIRKLAQKRFRQDSVSSTVPNLPTEQLTLLERIANVNIPLDGQSSQKSGGANGSVGTGVDEEASIGILGAEPHGTEVKDEDDEIEIVIPSPKTPPPVIDLDDAVADESNTTSEPQPSQSEPLAPPEPQPSSSGCREEEIQPAATQGSARPESFRREPATPRRISEVARTVSTSADDLDSQDDGDEEGDESETRRPRRDSFNPFLLANNVYPSGVDGTYRFDRARRLYNRCEQMNSLLDSINSLQEEESSIDLEIRALHRRKEQVHRQLMNYVRRLVNIGSAFPEDLCEKKGNPVELKETGTDVQDFPSDGLKSTPEPQQNTPAAGESLIRANSSVRENSDSGRPVSGSDAVQEVPDVSRLEGLKGEPPPVQEEEEATSTVPADPLEIHPPAANLAEECHSSSIPNVHNILLTIKEEIFDQDEYSEVQSSVPESPVPSSPVDLSQPAKKRKTPEDRSTIVPAASNSEPKRKKKKNGHTPLEDGVKQKTGKKEKRSQETVTSLQKLKEDNFVELGQHDGSCLDLTVANDYLVTCSQDRTISVYSLSTSHLIRTITGKHGGSISQVLMVDPEEPLRGKNLSIFTACMDNCFREFCLQTGRLQHLSDYRSAIQSMAREGGNFYLGCHNGEVHHYRAKHRSSKLKLRVGDAVTCLRTCSLNGVKCLLVAVKDRGVVLADASTGNEVRRFEDNEASVMGLCTIDQVIYAADSARNVIAYNLATGKKLGMCKRRKGCICMVERNGYIFIAGLGAGIDVFDRKLTHLCSIPVSHKAVVFSLDIDKSRLFVGDRAGSFGYYPLPLM